MPPRNHSSGSHSSSRSSGSFRSSGSSYRSSPGRSSGSSSSRSGSSGSYNSSRSGGPSRHSSSSHSGSSVFSKSPYQAPPVSKKPSPPPGRPRINQPIGYLIGGALAPRRYYGRKHDYVYYPESWTDSSTGRSYEKGYYDENGQFYDSVAFQENGAYQNVVCHCPYCDQTTILNLDKNDGAAVNLQCPNCLGQMEIKSELDEILTDSSGNAPAPNTHEYGSGEFRQDTKTKKKKRRVWLIVLAALVALGIENSVRSSVVNHFTSKPGGHEIQQITVTGNNGSASSNTVSFGSAVYLEGNAQNGYRVVNDVIRADRILYYDSDSDSYYDEASDCYLYYNTDVEPNVWQYWYEGISSDFGDYGWMEHDSTGWYIEASKDNWIELPKGYDADSLWYINS